MDPAKGQRGRKNGNITRLEGVHRVPVAVESDEFSVLGDIHVLAVALHQRVVTRVEAVLEDIGHRRKLDPAAIDTHRICRCPGAASAAANERDLNRITALGVNVRDGHSGQCRNCGDPTGCFNKFTTGSGLCIFVHNEFR